MVRPICFMIMPFGVKPTQLSDDGKAPDKVDFNRLWDAALRPAITQLGYEAVRADQDAGALIINEMIERLALSDLVLADVSIGNANVYYEVGIRHTANRQGCVLIGADWAKPLFDIDQMRQLRYPLPAEHIDDAAADAIIRKLVESIPKLMLGISPVYQALPRYPELDRSNAASFRAAMEAISRFQAEVAATRAAPPADRAASARALRDSVCGGGKPLPNAVALELLYLLRDCSDWHTTMDYIDQLPAQLAELAVVKEQRALAQSKDGDHLAAIGGLQALIQAAGDSSERRGLLGGRYKKLWQGEQDALRKRQYLDFAIKEYEAGMRLDLNDYYPACNLPLLYRERGRKGDAERARTAAAITQVACERARARRAADPWLNPTLLGAAFLAGDVDKARELADLVRTEGAAVWQLQSTLNDLKTTVAALKDTDKATELKLIVEELEALT